MTPATTALTGVAALLGGFVGRAGHSDLVAVLPQAVGANLLLVEIARDLALVDGALGRRHPPMLDHPLLRAGALEGPATDGARAEVNQARKKRRSPRERKPLRGRGRVGIEAPRRPG